MSTANVKTTNKMVTAYLVDVENITTVVGDGATPLPAGVYSVKSRLVGALSGLPPVSAAGTAAGAVGIREKDFVYSWGSTDDVDPEKLSIVPEIGEDLYALPFLAVCDLRVASVDKNIDNEDVTTMCNDGEKDYATGLIDSDMNLTVVRITNLTEKPDRFDNQTNDIVNINSSNEVDVYKRSLAPVIAVMRQWELSNDDSTVDELISVFPFYAISQSGDGVSLESITQNLTFTAKKADSDYVRAAKYKLQGVNMDGIFPATS